MTPIIAGQKKVTSVSTLISYKTIKAIPLDYTTGSDAEIDTDIDFTSAEDDGKNDSSVGNIDTEGKILTKNNRVIEGEVNRDDIISRRVKFKKRGSKFQALTESRVRRRGKDIASTHAIEGKKTSSPSQSSQPSQSSLSPTPIPEYKEHP